jgi:hypothetical protein
MCGRRVHRGCDPTQSHRSRHGWDIRRVSECKSHHSAIVDHVWAVRAPGTHATSTPGAYCTPAPPLSDAWSAGHFPRKASFKITLSCVRSATTHAVAHFPAPVFSAVWPARFPSRHTLSASSSRSGRRSPGLCRSHSPSSPGWSVPLLRSFHDIRFFSPITTFF